MRDFTHIAYIGGPPNVFVVNPSLGVRSLKTWSNSDAAAGDRLRLARRGTLGHLLAESFASDRHQAATDH